ncbi:MAG: flagellar basal body-associated FliL family protein [Dethiobacter sp.]|jgi:flagellar FliL protein|nr:flagellar basal body-associated FliL family protein [Dethiobacter sp.]MBS3902186.1 flagellar basal body-associated FliL family protein [Dethiobacter sp.]MBS3988742.1 flagellar basal body-associated FliL family protein [Dethiobacter sp.]
MSSEKKDKQPGKSKTKLLLIAVIVLALLAGGLGFYTFFVQANQDEGVNQPVKEEPLLIHGPEDFTVNLSDREQRRYLRATIALGYADEKMSRELEQRSVQIRDMVIKVLRSFSTEDMATAEGVARLRAELIKNLNALLTSGEIKEIYFTELLVQ